MQPGDVKATYANTDLLQEWIGFKPKTTIKYPSLFLISEYLSFLVKIRMKNPVDSVIPLHKKKTKGRFSSKS